VQAGSLAFGCMIRARKLAAPGAIAVPYATSELAGGDTQRPPDHEPTLVLPARSIQDTSHEASVFTVFLEFRFCHSQILAGESTKN
jgi:hypothetical protein